MELSVNKVVGRVTPEECQEIRFLFERKNGLNELVKILDINNSDLYEMVVKDLGETSTKFQEWWDRMLSKYQWEEVDGGHWEIDFETNEISLIRE